ncbi:MAG: hypothetical protein M3457_06995 [Chloroflexota bacterium]|nr:hypothetical protein [Chloroflexota bacterium]
MSQEQRPARRFHHIGLRAFEPQPNEDFVSATKTWVTDPANDPNRIEYLRYEPDCPIADEFKNTPHIAYAVDDLATHLAGKDVYLEPFEVGTPPYATVAFTREDGVFIEYMQFNPGRRWFNE